MPTRGEPRKLAELKATLERLAKEHQVYPMNDSTSELAAEAMKKRIGDRTVFRYEGVTRATPEALSPPVKNRSHAIVAKVRVPDGGAEGVLATIGGQFGGYAFYVKEGKLTYVHNFVGEAKYAISSTRAIPTGDHELRFVFDSTGENTGKGRLYVDQDVVGEGDIPRTVPFIYSATESFDTGMDTGTADGDYEVPFEFTGRLDSVTVKLGDLQGKKPSAGSDDVPDR